MQSCPLCNSTETEMLFTAKASKRVREFHRCHQCDLVFVPKQFHISSEDEREQYDLHQNDAKDARYMHHLKPVVDLVLKLKPERVLDFGSGPNPVLVQTLRLAGVHCTGWDPFYDSGDIIGKFSVVTSTEVVEHFCDPALEWKKLEARVDQNGAMIVMTSLTDGVSSLKDWHYIRDITHVTFYSQKTMNWIADWLGYSVTIDGNVSHFAREN